MSADDNFEPPLKPAVKIFHVTKFRINGYRILAEITFGAAIAILSITPIYP
jgi:hypothetical protein